jgi:hypothetical protein
VDWLIFAALVVALIALAAVAQRKGWIDLSDKNKSTGGGTSPMVIGDEVFNPSRYEAAIELDRQTVLPAPAPLPGDGDKGVYKGNVRIELPRQD